ncbi:hypothetical protein HDV06_000342 [Boothiomyces sp. JEL0866]|nr:hypothetical protein HDV06_000342 [Boothiomyces sp. JEL0866]
MDPLTTDQVYAVVIATTVLNAIGICVCSVAIGFQLTSLWNGKLLGLNSQLILILISAEILYEAIQILSNWMVNPGVWCTFSAWGYISFGNVTILNVCAIALNLIVALVRKSQISNAFAIYLMLILPTTVALVFGSLPLSVDGYGFNEGFGSCYYTDDTYASFWPWISYNMWAIAAIFIGFSSTACVTVYVKALHFKISDEKSLNSLTSAVIIRTMYYPAVLTITQIPSILQNAYPNSGLLVALAYMTPALQGVLHGIIYLTSPNFKRDFSKLSVRSSSQTSTPVIVSIS